MSLPDVFVALTLRGDFNPVSVTGRFCVEPSHTHVAGHVANQLSGRARSSSVWSVDSRSSVDADTIEPHLQWLLDLIEPRGDALFSVVSDGAFAFADCFWSSPGASGGPWITPESMRRLAALNLPLIISFYASADPDDAEGT